MRRFWFAVVLALGLPRLALAQEAEARLLRFPTIHGQHVVFSSAGNLYTVATAGGIARRLTSHDGYEMFARFSPDGKKIAFTGQYDGNTEVYVMPSEGGTPQRLTFSATLSRDEVSDRMGPNNIVMTWKNNDEIVFRSRMRDPNDFIGQLFAVNVKGGLPVQIPLPRGGFCSFSPDGSKLAYNRIFREFRTWKRYRGGMADEIWVRDFKTGTTEKICDNPACDVFPMWAGDTIYYLSDRDANKRFNLYAYSTKTKETRQVTHHKDFDIKFPSLGPQAIVYELGGYLYRFDLKTEQTAKIPVRILEDDASDRPRLTDVSKNIESYDISPDGKRALFCARGDLFTLPAKNGPTRDLTGSNGIHERAPKWSPDGKWIACISDASGEDEIHLVPPTGHGERVQLTEQKGTYKYPLAWSPDSKKILWSDKKMRLQFVDVASKKIKQVDASKVWEIRHYAWSPDSKWIAYARYEEQGLPKIWLYSLEQDKTFPVTDGWYDASRPEFSGDGKYLFFVAETEFSPNYSGTEWNHGYSDMAKLYLVTLTKETPSPFLPKSDEAAAGKDEKPTPMPAAKEEKKEKAKEAFHIDTEGLGERLLSLPVTAGNYSGLSSVGGTLYYFRNARKSGSGLYLYDLAGKKETGLGEIAGYEISANGQKMLVNKGGQYSIIDLPKSTISLGDIISLSGLQVMLDRQREWKQIFRESWRQMRDYFYDPNLHGVDWKAMRDKYEPLVAHVHHRSDLNYVIGEMIGELNVGHAYVGGGDLPKVERIKTGLLGAELQRDEKSKTFKIVTILPGDRWDHSVRSPLAELGVNVREGDYLLAIDGKPTSEMLNPYESLVNTVGKQVRLKVNSTPDEKGSREVVVVPIADEQPLYYRRWVQNNIKKVSDATKGQVGYVHIPDMQATGLNEFAKHYYPQLRKKALIIDVRGNGGGNVSPMIIERLRREIAMIDLSRDTLPRPDPLEIMMGPKVCLMNEYSASDGDIFPYRFRHYKLGKLIGKRSWGGTVGIRGTLPFLDGGSLNKPEFASYTTDGKAWAIEGHGVDPDIVVDNDPSREYRGIDDQLNRAIEEIMEEVRRRPTTLPSPPPYPKR